jgi:hypothetical protein
MKRRLFIFLAFLPILSAGQPLNFAQDPFTLTTIFQLSDHSDSCIHTSLRPFLANSLNPEIHASDILYPTSRDSVFLSKRKYTWIWRKLRKEDFIRVKDPDLKLGINPLLNVEFGRDLEGDSSLFLNTRGIQLYGSVSKNIAFNSEFYENQGFFLPYMSEYINKHYVVPGQGRSKAFKGTGFDYAGVSGYLSWSPVRRLTIQAGHGKTFIGEGYRSLLLSDFSYNYPYFRTILDLGKIRYTNMLTAFQRVNSFDTRETVFRRTHGSFIFMDWVPVSWFQAGLFEGIIWQTSDSGYTNRFSLNYFNPVIGFRPLQMGLNDNHNVLMGLTGRVRPFKGICFYGQWMMDDLDLNKSKAGSGPISNRTGWQAGIRISDPFKIRHLFLQAELNNVRPYSYSHAVTLQNYSNFNEPLAHPLGANFREAVGILRYQFKDFFIHLKYVYAVTGQDSDSLFYGSDIFRSDQNAYLGSNSYGNVYLQGILTTITNLEISGGVILNPRTNLQLTGGFRSRSVSNHLVSRNDRMVFFGIRTSLNSLYNDF